VNTGGPVVVGALVTVVVAGAALVDVVDGDFDASRASPADDDPPHAVVAHVAAMTAVMSKARRHTFGVR
jgi:hypothetical protein